MVFSLTPSHLGTRGGFSVGKSVIIMLESVSCVLPWCLRRLPSLPFLSSILMLLPCVFPILASEIWSLNRIILRCSVCIYFISVHVQCDFLVPLHLDSVYIFIKDNQVFSSEIMLSGLSERLNTLCTEVAHVVLVCLFNQWWFWNSAMFHVWYLFILSETILLMYKIYKIKKKRRKKEQFHIRWWLQKAFQVDYKGSIPVRNKEIGQFTLRNNIINNEIEKPFKGVLFIQTSPLDSFLP